MTSFNVINATAGELHALLNKGSISCLEIAQQYLQHIQRYNGRLHALIEVAPEATVLAIARQLDEERLKGSMRGPLHGIPIILKDNIVTHPSLGLRTTGGSFAFLDLRPKDTAPCVRQMIEGGCIVIGKANLSEFANFKGKDMPCGWSARGGQTQSPYVKNRWDAKEKFGGHSGPGGSSSGSATAVAAGFAPISVGTETWGSLIMPATRANVFTLKGTRGMMPMTGIMPVSGILDIAGPMARSAIDIAIAYDHMVDHNNRAYPADGYVSKASGSWKGLKLGAVNTKDWQIDEMLAEPDSDWFQQQEHDLTVAYAKLQDLGVPMKNPVSFPEKGPLAGVLGDVINHNFVRCFDAFLSEMEFVSIKSVQELVQFNKEHADQEMPAEAPNQDVLLDALNAEPWSEEKTLSRLEEGKTYAGAKSIDYCLEENDINVILGPADSWLTDFACVAGYPSAMLPLSFWKKNGRALGVIALTTSGREDLLIQLMSAWETAFPVSHPPRL